MEEVEKFQLHLIHDFMKESLLDEDDVKLKEYLESFQELNKFFNLIGTVFSFVSKDLQSKMEILYNYLNDDVTKEHFKTCKSMMEYEKDNNLLDKKGYVSGSRTLLRLHRGLDFIRKFLQKIGELEDTDNTSTACKEIYENTLAKYHSFVVRNGAKLAMYTIPNRKELLKRVCAGEEDIAHAMKIMPETLENMSLVYDRIENLYSINNLHSLP